MKFAIWGVVLTLALTVDVCHAQWRWRPKNTPLDWNTWIPRPRGDQGSWLPVQPDPPPHAMSHRWEYRDGFFEYLGNRAWIERRYNGPPSHFREIARSSDWVHLFDSSRQMNIVLTRTQGLVAQGGATQWTLWGHGGFR
jgi:hypothetical protein